jgi:exportin-T
MAPPPALPLPAAKRQFLMSLLEVVVQQLEWAPDAEWEAPGNDEEIDEDVAAFWAMRSVCLH